MRTCNCIFFKLQGNMTDDQNIHATVLGYKQIGTVALANIFSC